VNPQPRGNVRHDATGEMEENVLHYYPAHNEADMLQAFATAAGNFSDVVIISVGLPYLKAGCISFQCRL